MFTEREYLCDTCKHNGTSRKYPMLRDLFWCDMKRYGWQARYATSRHGCDRYVDKRSNWRDIPRRVLESEAILHVCLGVVVFCFVYLAVRMLIG